MSNLPKAPEGYVWVRFGGTGEDRGVLTIGGEDVEKIHEGPVEVADDVVIPFPLPETCDEHASTRTFRIETVDGEMLEYRGSAAAVAQKVKHDYEQIRGQYRTVLEKGVIPDPDAVRRAFRQIVRPGEKVQITALDIDKAEAMTKADLIKDLKARGILK